LSRGIWAASSSATAGAEVSDGVGSTEAVFSRDVDGDGEAEADAEGDGVVVDSVASTLGEDDGSLEAALREGSGSSSRVIAQPPRALPRTTAATAIAATVVRVEVVDMASA
jgi:hypothetical protein